MFYAGNKACYGVDWFFAFGIIIFGLCSVLYVFKLLYSRKSKLEHDFRFAAFTIAYREEYWYWEFVLLLRRFGFALFAAVPFEDITFMHWSMFMLTIFLFFAHSYSKPFRYSRLNLVESLLYTCLSCVLMIYV